MAQDKTARNSPVLKTGTNGGEWLARIIHEALEAAVLQRDRRAVFRGVGDAVVGV
jgi:hypothetical protein